MWAPAGHVERNIDNSSSRGTTMNRHGVAVSLGGTVVGKKSEACDWILSRAILIQSTFLHRARLRFIFYRPYFELLLQKPTKISALRCRAGQCLRTSGVREEAIISYVVVCRSDALSNDYCITTTVIIRPLCGPGNVTGRYFKISVRVHICTYYVHCAVKCEGCGRDRTAEPGSTRQLVAW
jgi:hypothetical protein